MKEQRVDSVAGAMKYVAGHLARIESDLKILYLPGNTGLIPLVESWIFNNAHQLRGVHVFQTLALGPAHGWSDAVAQGVIPVTPFIGPGVRELVNEGLAKNIRCNLSQVPRLVREHWKPQVAIAHVSPPDQYGRVTLGLNAGLDYTAVRSADFKVAVVNEQMPRWHIGMYYDPPTNRHFETGCAMSLSEFDIVVHINEPLHEHKMSPKADQQEQAAAVAEHIFTMLAEYADESGDLPHTLQLGIGSIPNAVAGTLAAANVSVSSIWSEMFSNGVLDLYRNGLIKRLGGTFLRDHIVVGFVLGDKDLYWEMHQNPDFAVLPQEYVNDPALIKHNPYMVSINSTISASVTGEIAAATMHRRYHSDVGGQNDFALGASWSEGGVAIIAFLSTATLKNGSLVSKIVATHPEGTHNTISADLPVVVVTEYGVADLRMVDDRDRVLRMLTIAHPDWRQYLGKMSRALPAIQGVDTISPRLVSLRNGDRVILRPATHEDVSMIKSYIPQLSAQDRETRYLSTGITIESLTDPERLKRLYDTTLDFIDHAAFVVEKEDEVLGVAHAYRTSDGLYELSFSRRSDLAGQGIGSHLMCVLYDWARKCGVQTFRADVLSVANPRMISLFRLWKFSVDRNPDDPTLSDVHGSLKEITPPAGCSRAA
ncbi:MAG: GNAT family N-acetyltransferase [Candidatus Kaiserbacteria bacterium]|nr:GNAT family N-acetyltransferase [Candidatus Kaiserbacteria bacterium]MCB9816465.1 GNAT family N-acetyltransferase [Candidatus Nomurabacteria bacterium]